MKTVEERLTALEGQVQELLNRNDVVKLMNVLILEMQNTKRMSVIDFVSDNDILGKPFLKSAVIHYEKPPVLSQS